ncbi:MAG: hypothetical protein HY812_06780 [Planctomycetes bacterium]|nr:hypothetical protein [Planctomycetota bacterium]
MGPLPAGRYALRLALPDESWGFDHCVVDVPAGAVARADFVLARALIEGSIVRDTNSAPLGDAWVVFTPCETAGAPGLEELGVCVVEADERGRFREILPAGRDYSCEASDPTGTLRARRIVRLEPGPNDLTIRLVPCGEVEVRLDSGLVRAAGPWLDRGAAPDVLVTPSVFYDQGRMWRLAPVREGVHRVSVERLGPEGKPVLLEQEVQVSAGGEAEARFAALVETAPPQ